jgi:DNA-binding beta-propeller fold protein YncE
VYIDPATGDIYAIDNDVSNTLTVFSRQATGNVPPDRELYTPHGTFGIAVDENAQEMYLTIEHDNAMVVFKKTAEKDDPPVRLLQGSRTGLADPHGIAIDAKNRLMFITNYGSFHEKVPGGKLTIRGGSRARGKPNWPVGDGILGSGKNLPASITIHALDAQGNTPPLRTIQGPNTQLNWPAGIAFDPKRNEVFVANDTGHSVLVFSATADGNVAPVRILSGPRSLIKNPLAVFVDTKNDELWVTNFGNHTATVYAPTATGDTPPLRVIRSTALSAPAANLGRPGAIVYDSRRDELLVPN